MISVNPVVCECNDAALNDIQQRPVTADHVREALQAAESPNVSEGSVGAGVGMASFGWASGIGTASRRVTVGDHDGVVGVLVLTNTGEPADFRIGGVPVGERLTPTSTIERAGGSIAAVVGTNLPLSTHQLGRLVRRSEVGLGRTGAVPGHRTGDFSIAFSTAPHTGPVDGDLRPAFQGAAEAVEESIYNSVLRATAVERPGEGTIAAVPVEDVRRLLSE